MVRIYKLLVMFGINPVQTIRSIKGLPYYLKNFYLLSKQKKNSVKNFPFGRLYPCLDDRFSNSGLAKGHYFHQDLLVARRIYLDDPVTHIDVGSRVDGFVAHVASFRTIKVLDIRPLPNNIPNMQFKQADLMTNIRDDMIECCDSLSCLHAIEHFGLGRYGDIVNYDGYILGLENLYQMLRKGGVFYCSVPIGPQRIEFDAHRVFSVSYLLELFDGKYRVENFSFIDDEGDLHESVEVTENEIQNNFGCLYGCGILEMRKL